MKPVRASVHQEARFTMQHCAKKLNYGHVMKMSGSFSTRSRLHRRSHRRVHQQQQQQTQLHQQKQHQPQNQQSLLSEKAFTTMLHVLCISVFYLFFANTISFVAANSGSESGVGGKNGLHLDTDLPTTTEFGESFNFMMIAFPYVAQMQQCIHTQSKTETSVTQATRNPTLVKAYIFVILFCRSCRKLC